MRLSISNRFQVSIFSSVLPFFRSSVLPFFRSSGCVPESVFILILCSPYLSSTSITINSGANNSTSDNVTLTLTASDTDGFTGYFASETSTTPASSADYWTSITSSTSYSDKATFTLSSGYDNKTIYVWFKDAAANVSSVASDNITLIQLTVLILNTGTDDLGNSYTSSNIEWQLFTATENDGLSSGLTWVGDKAKLDNATSYCNSLSLASYTDWRLPTKVELASLIDTSVSAPKIVDELVSTNESLYYWSSTALNSDYNYGVKFSDGSVGGYAFSVNMHVRCARDGS